MGSDTCDSRASTSCRSGHRNSLGYAAMVDFWQNLHNADCRNFTKFLVGKDGKVVKRYGSTTKPEDIEKDVKALL
jgi:glutathione peroxidase-family protein